MNAGTPETVVICPLAIEARAVRAALRRTGRGDVRVVVCGPGPVAAAHAVRGVAAGGSGRPLLVLAGVAGALADADGVPRISRVMDAAGRVWPCPSLGGAGGCEVGRAEGVTVLGLDEPAGSPESKRRWYEKTGAELVDTESQAFAAACEQHGFAGRWAVVRGVSDSREQSLPAQVARWVNARGRTRVARVLLDIALRPRLAAAAVRLGRRSGAVLPKVGARVAELVTVARALGGEPDPPGSGAAPITPLKVPRDTPLVILFGGAFDPPHRAHAELPARVRDELERRLGVAGRVWLVYVPAARTPLKGRGPVATAEQRLAMLRLAVAGLERVFVWTDEIDRDSGESYTIDTVRRAREWLDGHGGGGTRLRVLVGADQARQFHRWREAREIVRLAEPVVMPRTRQAAESAGECEDGDLARGLERDLRATRAWDEKEVREWIGRVAIDTTAEHSSTAARSRLAHPQAPGQELSLLLDRRVLEFIERNGLYGASSPTVERRA